MGVQVEVRWVPAHAGVEGNNRADIAARLTGNSVRKVIRDEGLELIEAGFGRTGRPQQILDPDQE